MKRMRVIYIIFLAVVTISVIGCGKHHVKEKSTVYKTAKIFKNKDAQVAIGLSKNLKPFIVSPRAGEEILCKLTPKDKGKKVPPRDNPACGSLGENNKVIAREVIEITVREGSCCVDISMSTGDYYFCSPPFPVNFITDFGGQC